MTKFVGNTITLPTLATAPSSPVNGDAYYNTTDNKVYARINGAWVDLAATGGGGNTVYYQTSAPVSANTGDIWVDSDDNTELITIPVGSTSQQGIVQLTDSTSSTSTTTAATPNSVKTAYDLAAAAVPSSSTLRTGNAGPVSGIYLSRNTEEETTGPISLSGDIQIIAQGATQYQYGVVTMVGAVMESEGGAVTSGGVYTHVLSATNTILAVLYGLSASGATHTRDVLTTTNTNTSGTLILTRFIPLKSFSVANISFTSGATASSALTYCAFGIYTRSGTTFTRQRITASDTTIFNTANTKYTRALTSGYSVTAGSEYFIGVLQVGTTMATTLAATARADTAANAATGVQVYTVASQTTLVTPVTGTANTTRSDFAEVS
jgi:hypothetical protein